MSLYNSVELKKLSIISEAKMAFRDNLISTEEFYLIENENKTKFYIPGIAIRIGLFLSVLILSAVVFGLFFLMFYDSFKGLGFISVFLFFISLIVTYYLSVKKMHFGSGADNAFLYAAIIFLMMWFSSTFNPSSGIGSSFILFIICAAASIIFIDKFLMIVSFIAFLCFFYFTFHNFISLDLMMISIMLLSFLIALAANKFLSKVEYWNEKLLKTLLYSALTAGFIAINPYYISTIINDSFFFKIVFDILTVIVPIVYILIGIKNKNIIFLRCGMFLFLAAIFSLIIINSKDNFFEFLGISSALMVAFSWWLSRYLLSEKKGFIFHNKSGISNIESIGAINSVKPPSEGFNFGGGNFGGGGASGEF